MIELHRHNTWQYRVTWRIVENAEHIAWAFVCVVSFLIGWSLP